ncbi:hypothetical protein H5410_038998 [Solanum commersonii]|uniref:Uncharacterized protein n=1 Tax=Solanum commersonii TaxID=4109 RepID=A0A9J5YFH1_SOLCO|nr:hypothetical protein H5410_038998 [Solanum commersonii]
MAEDFMTRLVQSEITGGNSHWLISDEEAIREFREYAAL